MDLPREVIETKGSIATRGQSVPELLGKPKAACGMSDPLSHSGSAHEDRRPDTRTRTKMTRAYHQITEAYRFKLYGSRQVILELFEENRSSV